jgi:hypothetical protein
MRRIKVKIFWAWYDAWIGAYWNRDKRILYICPLIFVVIAISFPGETKPYRPANGTEGEIFMSKFCEKCEYDRNEDCEIILLSMCNYTTDPDYPKYWIYKNGKPICTKFKRLKSRS